MHLHLHWKNGLSDDGICVTMCFRPFAFLSLGCSSFFVADDAAGAVDVDGSAGVAPFVAAPDGVPLSPVRSAAGVGTCPSGTVVAPPPESHVDKTS